VAVTLHCEELKMRYPGQRPWALGDDEAGVTFDVSDGELFALLGPSGCGKTTTLRIVGGFLRPDAGRVVIEGQDVTRLPPYARPTNTVFQSYALFPHKSIAANVEFGPKTKKVRRADRKARVERMLEMVGLSEYAERRVAELSGGQAQRVALARALVNEPAVLLLDEPLGALDLKLRRQMQDELVRVKRESGVSFIHVTHDQEEACAIADRIAVMDAGHIVQIATPVELYRQPKNTYVAEFINAGTVIRGSSRRSADVCEVISGAMILRGPATPQLNGSSEIAAVLPPHLVRLQRFETASQGATAGPDEAAGTIERVVFTGDMFECYVRTGGDAVLKASLSVGESLELGGELSPGASVRVSWRPEDVLFVEAIDA
jgi:spermidine/putrescine transport system ATP-binding protein